MKRKREGIVRDSIYHQSRQNPRGHNAFLTGFHGTYTASMMDWQVVVEKLGRMPFNWPWEKETKDG